MEKEYITEILEHLKASELLLKELDEGKRILRLRTEDVNSQTTGIIMCPIDITVAPDEPLYAAIKHSVKTEVLKYTEKLKDILGISEFDPRLGENI